MTWKPYMLEVGDARLRVAERGTSDTPLLLLNGVGAHLDMWAPFEQALGERHVIAFDLPGCGESPRSHHPQRMGGLAELVGRLLDTLGHERADVLGISFGGALAQEVAHRLPDRVRRLVLCATSPGTISVPPRPLAWLYLMTPARYMHPMFFRVMMPEIVGGKTARDRASLTDQMDARLAHPPDLIGYVYQLYAVSGWSSLPYLRGLRPPTLVLAGDDDRAIPLVNARLLTWAIPEARLHVLHGGGHAFLLDEPERAAPVIDEFLNAA